jgi:hypothetical protein
VLRVVVDARQRPVTITSERHPSVQECLRALDTVRADPSYESDFSILYDRRRDHTAPELAMVNSLIAYLREQRLTPVRCAVVLPPLVASLRDTLVALDTIAAELRLPVRPFVRVEDAKRWLGVE